MQNSKIAKTITTVWLFADDCRENMHLCIIYKASYNLAMFRLLEYPLHKPHPGPQPVALWGWIALPQSVVEAETLNQFKASFPDATY